MDWREEPWTGVFAATLCAFHEDESLDEAGLAEYVHAVAAVDGVSGVVCNGHTGEVTSLRPAERAQVTRVVSQAVENLQPAVKVISGVMAEGSAEAIDHAIAAREAGADAVLLMPPHHWLRFGRGASTAVGFVEDVADAAAIDVVLHQYPAWTKARYSLPEMLAIAELPRVVMIKMGTRDMSRWDDDYQRLKQARPALSIVSCCDEALLPTLLAGADGVLVGLAGFAPRLVVNMVHAALDENLVAARAAQAQLAPLVKLIYDFGEPGGAAHQRMKVARWLLGRFPSPHFRRPIRPLPAEAVAAIHTALHELGSLDNCL